MLPFKKNHVSISVAIFFIVNIVSGCSATLLKGNLENNPLLEIAKQAEQNDYHIEWVDETTLKVRDTWPLHSTFTLGWTSFHGDLNYQNGDFSGKFYLRNISLLGALFFPQYIDTGDGFYGAFLKPDMRQQMDQILKWGGIPIEKMQTSYISP